MDLGYWNYEYKRSEYQSTMTYIVELFTGFNPKQMDPGNVLK